MAFTLDSVVPWGRNINEYIEMFNFTEDDLKKKIAGFGDGPASFNYEATLKGYDVTSFDPIYQFSKAELENRIFEVRDIIMKQMAENQENFIWTSIKNLEGLELLRMSAMKLFLQDYENGLKENRYIFHELPSNLPYDDNTFDIGISSHFLLMYTDLGYQFHIDAITEMLRVCKEVRIFPLVNLDAKKSKMINDVISYFKKQYDVNIAETKYEFQKNANRLLVINKY